jgi:biopolymer transport protein ExbD
MPSQNNLTLGQLMLQARMQAGVSVDAASSATRIPVRTIQAFENDDFDGMPPRGYAQNMLGAYARFLDIDPNRAFRLYSLGFDAAANGYHRAGYDNYRRNQPIDVSQSSIVDDRHRYGASADAGSAGGYAEARSPYRADSPTQGVEDTPYPRGSAQSYEGDIGDGGNPYDQDIEEDDDESDYSRDRYATAGARPVRATRTRDNANADSGRRGRADYRQSGVDYRRTHGTYDNDERHRKLVVVGLVAFIAVVLVVAIFLIITAGGKDTTNGTITVSGTTSNAATTSDTGTDNSSSGVDASNAATANEANTAATQTGATATATTSSTPYTVVFTVASGSSSWIEVTVDGATSYASTAVGPTTKSFTVTDTCEITIGAPTGVTVTRDGSPVTLTYTSAGIVELSMTASGTS